MRARNILLFQMVVYTLLACIKLTNSVPIFVNIAGDVDGALSYINISTNYSKNVVEIVSVWENTGSAGCKAYMRIDVKNGNGTVIYTSWSNIVHVAPGGIATLKNYWFFDNLSGNFSLSPRIYFCDEIRKFEDLYVNLNASQTRNVTAIRLNAISWVPAGNTTTIHVELNFPEKKLALLKDVLILPLTIPPGDKVYPLHLKQLEVKDGVATFQLKWDYGILVSKRIPLVLIDGSTGKVYRFSVVTEVRKEKKTPVVEIAFISGMLLGVGLTAILMRIRASKSKRSKKR